MTNRERDRDIDIERERVHTYCRETAYIPGAIRPKNIAIFSAITFSGRCWVCSMSSMNQGLVGQRHPHLEICVTAQTQKSYHRACRWLSKFWSTNKTLNPISPYMSHSLNSLKEDYIGDYIGDYYRGY